MYLVFTVGVFAFALFMVRTLLSRDRRSQSGGMPGPDPAPALVVGA